MNSKIFVLCLMKLCLIYFLIESMLQSKSIVMNEALYHLRTFVQRRITCIHNEADNITSMPLSMTSVQTIYSLLLIPKCWIQSREASVYRKWIICAHKENINVVNRCHKEQKYNYLIICMPHSLNITLSPLLLRIHSDD